jgi:hypothetical protein
VLVHVTEIANDGSRVINPVASSCSEPSLFVWSEPLRAAVGRENIGSRPQAKSATTAEAVAIIRDHHASWLAAQGKSS